MAAEHERRSLSASPEGERLKAFIREHKPGGCRWLSHGALCLCPLCDVDRLEDARWPHPVIYGSRSQEDTPVKGIIPVVDCGDVFIDGDPWGRIVGPLPRGAFFKVADGDVDIHTVFGHDGRRRVQRAAWWVLVFLIGCIIGYFLGG